MEEIAKDRPRLGLAVFFSGAALMAARALLAFTWFQNLVAFTSGDTADEANRSFGRIPMLSAESLNAAANVLSIVLLVGGLYLICRESIHRRIGAICLLLLGKPTSNSRNYYYLALMAGALCVGTLFMTPMVGRAGMVWLAASSAALLFVVVLALSAIHVSESELNESNAEKVRTDHAIEIVDLKKSHEKQVNDIREKEIAPLRAELNKNSKLAHDLFDSNTNAQEALREARQREDDLSSRLATLVAKAKEYDMGNAYMRNENEIFQEFINRSDDPRVKIAFKKASLSWAIARLKSLEERPLASDESVREWSRECLLGKIEVLRALKTYFGKAMIPAGWITEGDSHVPDNIERLPKSWNDEHNLHRNQLREIGAHLQKELDNLLKEPDSAQQATEPAK